LLSSTKKLPKNLVQRKHKEYQGKNKVGGSRWFQKELAQSVKELFLPFVVKAQFIYTKTSSYYLCGKSGESAEGFSAPISLSQSYLISYLKSSRIFHTPV